MLGAVITLAVSARCTNAQSFHLPPHDAPHSGLLQAARFDSQDNTLSFSANGGGDTNVQPLLKDSAPPFHSAWAYFHSFSLYRVTLQRKRWAISYGYGEANLYQGNNGAVQLYRETQQGFLLPDTRYPVRATLNRVAVNTLSLTHSWNIPTAQLTLTAHWTTLRRAQYGTLQGEKQGDQFNGTITLYTTRGIAPGAINGQGFALDVGLLLRLDSHWRIGIKAENLLSYFHIGTLQQIESRVQVNRPTPDPDGFLHAPPVLEGQTRTRSLHAHAATHYQGIIAHRQSSSTWALMFSHDFRWRAGIAFARAGSIEQWGILWLEPPEWQLGLRSAHWELSVGFDRLHWSLAKRLSVRVQWGLPL